MTFTGMRSPMAATGNQKIAGMKVQQMPNFTPEQMDLFKSLFSQVSPDSFTGKLARGDQSQFEQMEAPAFRQFNELQGSLGSRFSGMGTGARRSSGFQNYSNQAASNFAQDLQSRRLDLQRNAIKELMGMSGDLLGQRPYENFLVEPNKKKSFWQQLIGGAAPLVGAGAGAFFGGPAGAAAGFQAGNAFGEAFQ